MNIVVSPDSCATLVDMRKPPFPLEELRSVDFFRADIPLPESDEDFALAVRHGVSLTKKELAICLPGFIGLEGKLKQQSD